MSRIRYLRRPAKQHSLIRLDDDDEYVDEKQIVYDLTVYDSEPIDTGLVYPDGDAIVRDDSRPIGFLAYWGDDEEE